MFIPLLVRFDDGTSGTFLRLSPTPSLPNRLLYFDSSWTISVSCIRHFSCFCSLASVSYTWLYSRLKLAERCCAIADEDNDCLTCVWTLISRSESTRQNSTHQNRDFDRQPSHEMIHKFWNGYEPDIKLQPSRFIIRRRIYTLTNLWIFWRNIF